MIKNVMNAVYEALSQVNRLECIGQDWGQLDDYGDRPPVSFPCALFDMGVVEYKDISLRSQEAEAVLRVRVADYRPAITRGDEFDDYKYFDIVDDVFGALQGLAGENFSSLSRQRLTKNIRKDGIREFVMEFAFGFTDNSAIRKTRPVKVPVELKVQRKVLID